MDILDIVKMSSNRNFFYDKLRYYGLDHYPISDLERKVYARIINQVFGQVRFSEASTSRHRTYRNHLSYYERVAIRLKTTYMNTSLLEGKDLYVEIAKVMTIKLKKEFSWQGVKDLIEVASEIVADIESSVGYRAA